MGNTLSMTELCLLLSRLLKMAGTPVKDQALRADSEQIARLLDQGSERLEEVQTESISGSRCEENEEASSEEGDVRAGDTETLPSAPLYPGLGPLCYQDKPGCQCRFANLSIENASAWRPLTLSKSGW